MVHILLRICAESFRSSQTRDICQTQHKPLECRDFRVRNRDLSCFMRQAQDQAAGGPAVVDRGDPVRMTGESGGTARWSVTTTTGANQ